MSALKAYAVLEHDERTGGILFARHAIVARKWGANEWGNGDLTSVSCNRMPGLDRFAEQGDVPASVLVEMGWHFECWCGARIDEDSLVERGLAASDVIGCCGHGLVFCGQRCLHKFYRQRSQRRRFERRVVDRLQRFVAERLPGGAFTGIKAKQHVYAEWHGRHLRLREAHISFAFPGMAIGPAQFVLSQPERHFRDRREPLGPPTAAFWCFNGDSQAFEAFAAACRRQRGAA